MAEKKPISKKLRFEVFKRDRFTCQYCGKEAPDVILHVDHIKPVSKSGTNALINLITSCQNFNLGKGATPLNDDSVISKQRKQLEDLQNKREQIEIIIAWREGFESLKDDEFREIDKIFQRETGRTISDMGKKKVKAVLKLCGFRTCLDALDIALDKFTHPESVFNYFIKVAKIKNIEKEKPYLQKLFYIRGYLEDRYLMTYDSEMLKNHALQCFNWRHFVYDTDEMLGLH